MNTYFTKHNFEEPIQKPTEDEPHELPAINQEEAPEELPNIDNNDTIQAPSRPSTPEHHQKEYDNDNIEISKSKLTTLLKEYEDLKGTFSNLKQEYDKLKTVKSSVNLEAKPCRRWIF